MAYKYDYTATLSTIKKREFWIGLATALIVLLVMVKVFPWNNVKDLVTNETNNKVVSPVPTEKIMTGTMDNNESTKDATMDNKKMLSKLKVLADTTGYYTIVEGDNYYKVSLKVCGDGRYFESIQAENNAVSLYAGDQIVVTCSE